MSLLLRFLYQTIPGRVLLKGLTAPGLSRACGAFLDTLLSRPLIPGFLKRNHIELSDYQPEKYRCFNDCFTRRIRPELRPVDMAPDHLPAPCDALLSAYHISEDGVIPVKDSLYTVQSLLRDEELAGEFLGGSCLVFRLCVEHYHRYIWAEGGTLQRIVRIPGVLHTVRPVALRSRPVFAENTREYAVLDSEGFGRLVQMEVGAMLVGRIVNHPVSGTVRRGEEKGYFSYGGSTVILLLQKDKIRIDQKYSQAAAAGKETPVLQGQCIGFRTEAE